MNNIFHLNDFHNSLNTVVESSSIGDTPFSKTHTGAQVAPQRCPILLCGKSTFDYITLFTLMKGLCN